MTVGIITDSAASLPTDLAAANGIIVVPLLLTVGGVTYHDGELPLESLLARLDEGVSTSGPSPGEFAEAIDEGLRTHDHLLVLTIAETMSSTFDSARTAARLSGSDRVQVLDTATAAGAQGLVVLAAARRAAAGGDLVAVETTARDVMERVRLVATVGSLDRLVKSGRVPGIAGWAGGKLGVNPLFQFRGGGAHPLRPAFSRQAAFTRIVATWAATAAKGHALHVAALHANKPMEATHLLERVKAEHAPASAFVGEFSPVMVAHTGPDLVGLAWWWEPDGKAGAKD